MRTALHMLLGVLLWVVFAYYWHLVMKQPVTAETKRALVIVGSIVAAISLFDLIWIYHNIRIARRSQRRARRVAAPAPTRDFLGRRFVVQNEALLRRARYIEVYVLQMEDDDATGDQKLFRVTDEVPNA
jgi:hypothetical protein